MNYITFLSFISYFVSSYHFHIAQDPNNIFDIGEQNEDEEHKDFENEHFEFANIEIEKDKVKVESDSDNYEIEYEIESEDTNPIESKLKYKSTNSSGFETETKSRVLIHGIQEWYDDNDDGLMQDDEKVGDLYFVGENQYETITYVGPDSSNVYDFTISETNNVYLTMIAHLTSNFTENYDPNSMKFDIIIQDWIYQNNENQLALLMEYRTENEMETDENGYVSQKTTSPSLGYSALIWNETIIYDNNVGFVSTRILNTSELYSLIRTDDEYEGEHTSGIWFCFSSKGADKIYWDPNIGVYTTPLSSTTQTSRQSSDNYISNAAIGVIVAASIAGCTTFIICYYTRFTRKSKKQPLKDAENQQSIV